MSSGTDRGHRVPRSSMLESLHYGGMVPVWNPCSSPVDFKPPLGYSEPQHSIELCKQFLLHCSGNDGGGGGGSSCSAH